jgi:hypothetical protein
MTSPFAILSSSISDGAPNVLVDVINRRSEQEFDSDPELDFPMRYLLTFLLAGVWSIVHAQGSPGQSVHVAIQLDALCHHDGEAVTVVSVEQR